MQVDRLIVRPKQLQGFRRIRYTKTHGKHFVLFSNPACHGAGGIGAIITGDMHLSLGSISQGNVERLQREIARVYFWLTCFANCDQ